MIRDSFFVQHVVKPTHCRGDQTANVLDLVFTNEQEMIDNIRHEASVDKSHHQTLLFKLRCNTETKLHDSYSYNFAKGNFDRLRNYISSQVVENKRHTCNTVMEDCQTQYHVINRVMYIILYTRSI